MKKLLFVTYGSGHVRMVLPLALAVRAAGLAEPVVLALTTAAVPVRQSGLPMLQFKDFLREDDEVSRGHGERLLAALPTPAIDPAESLAYLGLCYAELEAQVGAEQARLRYARDGRQAFLPVQTLMRMLRSVNPDLVLATNAPRAERAAIMAARQLGLPAVCVVDLFGIDEIGWLGAPDYADQVCVLNASVKQFLLSHGRSESQVSVTGNSAFDTLLLAQHRHKAAQWRQERGWQSHFVVLWPTQTEPALHPFNGRPGQPNLPQRALDQVVAWVLAQPDAVLCIRVRAGEAVPTVPSHERIAVFDQAFDLPPLLHMTDMVVTLNSTVGLEGHLVGTRLVQVLGSVFDQAMPLKAYGIADEAVPVSEIGAALARCRALPRAIPASLTPATDRVLDVLRRYL